jgi:hypothetical protein
VGVLASAGRSGLHGGAPSLRGRHASPAGSRGTWSATSRRAARPSEIGAGEQMSDEPQDVAEAFDEETTGSDPDADGRMDIAVDEPFLLNEEQVTEPILDSVETREDRLEPSDDEILAAALDEDELELIEADLEAELDAEDIGLVSDESDMSAEEAALHVIEPGQ